MANHAAAFAEALPDARDHSPERFSADAIFGRTVRELLQAGGPSQFTFDRIIEEARRRFPADFAAQRPSHGVRVDPAANLRHRESSDDEGGAAADPAGLTNLSGTFTRSSFASEGSFSARTDFVGADRYVDELALGETFRQVASAEIVRVDGFDDVDPKHHKRMRFVFKRWHADVSLAQRQLEIDYVRTIDPAAIGPTRHVVKDRDGTPVGLLVQGFTDCLANKINGDVVEDNWKREEFLNQLRDAANALRLLERHELTHGNLSPDAVRIGARRTAVLVDISFARPSTGEPTMVDFRSHPDVDCLRARFAAPEVRPHYAVKPPADVWSLGVIALCFVARLRPDGPAAFGVLSGYLDRMEQAADDEATRRSVGEMIQTFACSTLRNLPSGSPTAKRMAAVAVATLAANPDARCSLRTLCGAFDDDITLLNAAARNGETAVVVRLVTNGALRLKPTGDGRIALHFAAQQGNSEMAQALAEQYPDMAGEADNDCYLPLHYAAQHGHRAIVENLVRAYPDAINEHGGDDGPTPLFLACSHGHQNVVAALIRESVAKDVRCEGGRTAAHAAARAGHQHCLQLLVNFGCDLGLRDKQGRTCLHEAARNSNDCVKVILKSTRGIDDIAGLADRDGNTPLMLAAQNNQTGTILDLLDAARALPVEAVQQALRVAAECKHAGAISHLLSRGRGLHPQHLEPALIASAKADDPVSMQSLLRSSAFTDAATEQRERRLCAPLSMATEAGAPKCIEVLIDAGAPAAVVQQHLEACLGAAARDGALRTMTLLLSFIDRDSGVGVDVTNDKGETPLLQALRRGHRACAELLLGRGADIRARCSSGLTAAHHAAHARSRDCLELVQQMCGPDLFLETDQFHRRPLYYAVRERSPCVPMLLQHDADVNYQDRQRSATLLQVAASSSRRQVKNDVVKFLLLAGASLGSLSAAELAVTAAVLRETRWFDDVQSLDTALRDAPKHWTLLHLAAHCGARACLSRLVPPRGSPSTMQRQNLRFALDSTSAPPPLHLAAIAGHADCLRAIAEVCDVNLAANPGKKTALHYAAAGGHRQCVKDLLGYRKLKLSAADAAGWTPLEVAITCGRLDVAADLVRRNAPLATRIPLLHTVVRHLDCQSAAVADFVALLREKGVRADEVSDGATAAHAAASALANADACFAAFRLLEDNGADLTKTDSRRRTVLHRACESLDDVSRLLQLRDLDALRTVLDATDQTPLHVAAQRGRSASLAALLRRSPTLEARDAEGYTPLHLAILSGSEACVKQLLAAGASNEALTASGHTPLVLAIQKSAVACARVLVGSRCNLNNAGRAVLTPLAAAVGVNLPEIVALLLGQGADPSATSVVFGDQAQRLSAVKYAQSIYAGVVPCARMLLQWEVAAVFWCGGCRAARKFRSCFAASDYVSGFTTTFDHAYECTVCRMPRGLQTLSDEACGCEGEAPPAVGGDDDAPAAADVDGQRTVFFCRRCCRALEAPKKSTCRYCNTAFLPAFRCPRRDPRTGVACTALDRIVTIVAPQQEAPDEPQVPPVDEAALSLVRAAQSFLDHAASDKKTFHGNSLADTFFSASRVPRQSEVNALHQYFGVQQNVPIGRGGSATVCQCDNGRVARFARTPHLRWLSLLTNFPRHENILCPLFAFQNGPLESAIIMERASCSFLDQVYDGVSYDRVVSVARQLLRAVEHLHKSGLAHNDIKPSNLLMFQETVMLSDLEFVSPTTSADPPGKTPEYSPPFECGLVKRDLYCVGATLLEALCSAGRGSVVRFAEAPPAALRFVARLVNGEFDTATDALRDNFLHADDRIFERPPTDLSRQITELPGGHCFWDYAENSAASDLSDCLDNFRPDFDDDADATALDAVPSKAQLVATLTAAIWVVNAYRRELRAAVADDAGAMHHAAADTADQQGKARQALDACRNKLAIAVPAAISAMERLAEHIFAAPEDGEWRLTRAKAMLPHLYVCVTRAAVGPLAVGDEPHEFGIAATSTLTLGTASAERAENSCYLYAIAHAMRVRHVSGFVCCFVPTSQLEQLPKFSDLVGPQQPLQQPCAIACAHADSCEVREGPRLEHITFDEAFSALSDRTACARNIFVIVAALPCFEVPWDEISLDDVKREVNETDMGHALYATSIRANGDGKPLLKMRDSRVLHGDFLRGLVGSECGDAAMLRLCMVTQERDYAKFPVRHLVLPEEANEQTTELLAFVRVHFNHPWDQPRGGHSRRSSNLFAPANL